MTKKNSIMRYFDCDGMPEPFKRVAEQFHDVAVLMDSMLPDGPQKSAGLRKLLEARDCMVRAAMDLQEVQKQG